MNLNDACCFLDCSWWWSDDGVYDGSWWLEHVDVLWSMKCLDLFPLAQGPGDVKHEPLADRGDDPLAEQIIGDGSL
jgi:hypothetical protein